MKKLENILEATGALMALTFLCFDVSEYPIFAIPILVGFGMVYIGTKIGKEWYYEKEDFSDVNSGNYSDFCVDNREYYNNGTK